jgi:hypothetical protein
MEERQFSIRYRITMDLKCLIKMAHNQIGLEAKARQMMLCTEKLVANSNLKMELFRLITSTKQVQQVQT